MVHRVNRAGLDVLGMVVVQPSLHRLLHVVDREHRFHVIGQFLHFHTLDFVVDVPPRHFSEIAKIERSMPVFDSNGRKQKKTPTLEMKEEATTTRRVPDYVLSGAIGKPSIDQGR